MRKIRNEYLAQLLMQLKFLPQRQRLKQLAEAEKLISIIDAEKDYPFEFICFKITGYRPKSGGKEILISGAELADDLHIFISSLSGQVAQLVSEQNQNVFTCQSLADDFGVSTKTIDRWRKRGLIAKKFIFDDGKKRLGFLQSTVDAFAEKNPSLVDNAKNFTKLTDKQKKEIISTASQLSASSGKSRHQIIKQISDDSGRAIETVRYTIVNFENQDPNKKVFKNYSNPLTPHQGAEIYREYAAGATVKDLIDEFGRSKSSIYRIVNLQKARKLLSRKVEFITSEEFMQDSALDTILARKLPKRIRKVRRRRKNKTASAIAASMDSLPQYLDSVKDIGVLTRDEEIELFRRYNFLKYLVCITRAPMRPAAALGSGLRKIEKYLDQAEEIKNIIIEANLKLVVSIAKKHALSAEQLPDLISEGNFSLMRAVEKFDYTRGFRFSTYASWAIAKNFARKIPAEAARPDRARGDELNYAEGDLRFPATAGVVEIERAHKSLKDVIEENLDEREQYVVIHHFGLIGTVVKKKSRSLKQIGEDLSLSKERIRQIELIALQKLRHSLSAEEFEHLTG